MLKLARRRRATAAASLALLAASTFIVAACRPRAVTTAPAAAATATAPVVRFVAQAQIATGTTFAGRDVGGLSGLAYDRDADLLYAVIDDPTGHPPPRLLRFRWHPPAAPELVDWLDLADDHGALPTAGADLEGLARTNSGELFVSSEGDVKAGIAPWIGDFDVRGHLRRRLPLPAAFDLADHHGLSHNQGFEALTLAAGDSLIAGTESPLAQDQPPPPDEQARVRLLRWDIRNFAAPTEWLYAIDPQHAKPVGEAKFGVAGLVDLLPFSPSGAADHLLALERSYVDGVGFAVKLFEASLAGAEEVTGTDALANRAVRTATKRRLADFAALGVPIGNYECLTWGPAGEDGAPLLIVVSDNNFNAPEGTLLAAFALSTTGLGSGALSPGGRASSSSPSSPRTHR